MGDMAHTFYVRPWEHDLMNVWDYYAFTKAIDQMRAEASKHG